MDRISINYENFEPSHESIQNFKASMGYALGKGPSDATAKAHISKLEEEFSCIVNVHSMHGHFHIDVQASNLDNLYKDVCKKLVGTFEEWHKDPDNEKFRLK